MMPPPEHANRNENQTQDEKPGQDQVEDNPQIRVVGAAMSKEIDDPEADQDQGGGGGERAADEAYASCFHRRERAEANPS